MIGLTAVDPNGLGVIDEHVEDWCKWFHPGDWDEAGLLAGSSYASQVCGEGLAGSSK